MISRHLLLFIPAIMIAMCTSAQIVQKSQYKLDSLSELLPKNYPAIISSKANHLIQQLDKQSNNVLTLMERHELRIKKKLERIDSAKARKLLDFTKDEYNSLRQRIQKPTLTKSFIPSLDTLDVTLKFIQQNQWLISKTKEASKKLKEAQANLTRLETRFQEAEEIKKFLNERRQYLKDQIRKFSSRRYTKELKELNQQVYYYNARLNEYKSLLKDHKKAERKAIQLLSGSKLFKDFMRNNSQLASLFRLPPDPGDPAAMINLSGLQTRAQVGSLIQQQISAGGPSAQTQFSQNMQQAQDQIKKLRSKITELGSGSTDDIMPEGFKPNQQKIRSFFNRLEIGANMQSQKANGFFPVTSDLGLSVGYKLNDKSTVGIGGSYKVGLGKDIRHIHISHQGIGIRSFVDWKIKGSLWVSGGYEMIYRMLPDVLTGIGIVTTSGVKNQQSGLIGLSKKYQISKKLKGKLQLLWDFLSYQQVPRTQAIILRVGYNLK